MFTPTDLHEQVLYLVTCSSHASLSATAQQRVRSASRASAHMSGCSVAAALVLNGTTANSTVVSPLLWSSRSPSASTTLSAQATGGEHGRSASCAGHRGRAPPLCSSAGRRWGVLVLGLMEEVAT